MEWRERVFIHCLVKSSKCATSSGTLIPANSTGGRVQHCLFLVVLVLDHRLAMPCHLHNFPSCLGFPPKEAWAHRQECCPPAGPLSGMMREIVLWAGSQSLPFCIQDTAGAHGQGSGGAAPGTVVSASGFQWATSFFISWGLLLSSLAS